ncbi:MAG: ASCH domain-containing protein [Clostridia bacterium]|nr:ASCH domain-containing protein [Clostridia bacterium]
MKLNPEPFELIENEIKTIELRLLDEKRRKIRKGDIIRFERTDDETEVLRVSVKDLYVFKSFGDLYSILPLEKCGYTSDNIDRASPDDMKKYYSGEQLASNNVVGIKIELI